MQLVDRNPYSPTYGSFDRSYWHYRTMDFPCGMYQEFVLPLALVYAYDFPDNPYYRKERVKELALAGIDFARRSSHRDGSCDDYFPYERALGVAERHLELNPTDLSARLNRASNLMTLGRREEAFEQAQSVIESGSKDQRILYNTACFYSLAGEVEPALETLKRTVDAGYAAADWARNDSDLDNIRQDPRFQQLLEQMEANSRADSADGDSSGSS